jgi:hypothetical protein
VHGHSLLPIMVGLYQIALQKDWRWVRSSEKSIRKYFWSLIFPLLRSTFFFILSTSQLFHCCQTIRVFLALTCDEA